MRKCLFLILTSFLSLNHLHAEFNCGGFKATCKKPKNAQSGLRCSQASEDGKLVYCPYFQCDSNGKVLMSNSTAPSYKPPGVFGNGLKNIGSLSSDGVSCYGNCCYQNDTFLGEMNADPGCRNICCNSFESYVSGSCSGGINLPRPKKSPNPEITPGPSPPIGTTPQPEPEPTPPDLIPQSNIPDQAIGF